jgi:hypothetical protein
MMASLRPIVDSIIENVIEMFQGSVKSTQLSFVNNEIFYQLLLKRSNGIENEIRSLIFATLLNFLENPMATFLNGKLYYGGECNAMDIETLRRLGITHILNVAGDWSGNFLPRDNTRIIYKGITIEDVDGQILPIEEMVQYLDELLVSHSNNKVLIHCIEGKSRSGSLVLAYLMHHYHCGYDDAMQHMRNGKRVPVPNPGFEKQLRMYGEIQKRQQ